MLIKKGQKFTKDYSDELIATVIGEYINNQWKYQSIADKYNIASWHTVEMWVRKYRKNNQIIRQNEVVSKMKKLIIKKDTKYKKIPSPSKEQHEKK